MRAEVEVVARLKGRQRFRQCSTRSGMIIQSEEQHLRSGGACVPNEPGAVARLSVGVRCTHEAIRLWVTLHMACEGETCQCERDAMVVAKPAKECSACFGRFRPSPTIALIDRERRLGAERPGACVSQ